MAVNGYMADDLDVICGDLFENIEDFFDFSNDDEALEIAGSGVNCANIATVKSADVAAPPPPPPLSSSESSEGCRVTDASDDGKLCDDINIGEDWISKFLGDDINFEIDFPPAVTVDVSASAVAPMFINKDDESLFRSFSPVSVLEPNNLPNKRGMSLSSSSSSSSSTNSNTTNEAETVSLVAPVGPTMMLVPARARSKRPRRAAPASTTLPILPPSSDGPPAIPTMLPETESFGESYPTPMKKKKKKCLPTGANVNVEETVSAARKCMHCGIQKTPQWRAGPMGPKTLCNACGVRYKSGRLFPEYRPAASPTYLPSIHSNSHKKVVEMRNKVTQYKPVSRPVCPAAKNCDLLDYIRRKD